MSISKTRAIKEARKFVGMPKRISGTSYVV